MSCCSVDFVLSVRWCPVIRCSRWYFWCGCVWDAGLEEKKRCASRRGAVIYSHFNGLLFLFHYFIILFIVWDALIFIWVNWQSDPELFLHVLWLQTQPYKIPIKNPIKIHSVPSSKFAGKRSTFNQICPPKVLKVSQRFICHCKYHCPCYN